MNDPLLKIEELELELPTERGYVRILDKVSFELTAGDLVGLAGESGSGKTMTALSIMKLLPSDRAKVSGRILFRGVDLLPLRKREMQRIRGSQIAMVFQEPMNSLHPAYTVGEQIAEGIRAHQGVSRDIAWNRSVEMLERVGIPSPAARAKQYAFQFSGGMQQRAMMAIALANEPALLIADEPTTALDVTIQAQIAELIKGLQDELGMAVLFVTHDLGLLAGLASRMILMYAGQVIENAPTSQLFVKPLHPYTESLILSAPHPDLKGSRLPTIPGAPPRPGLASTGCRFHPRCRYARPACLEHEIELSTPTRTREVRCIRHSVLDLNTTPDEVAS